MIASPPASAEDTPAATARMRSLLLSWALLTAIWAPGLLLVELLVLHRVSLTAAALWTAALVPACQALALESLAAPLGLGAALVRLRRSFRSPWPWILWGLAGGSVVAAWLGGEGDILGSTAALLALAAVVLFVAAALRSGPLHTARGYSRLLALLLLLAISNRIAPWLEKLPSLVAPGWPPAAIRLFVVLPWIGGSYVALFRVQRALALTRRTAAIWLSAAAGGGALGLVAYLLPFRLDVAVPGTESLAPGTFFVLVTACLAAAGTAAFRAEPER